MDIGCTELGRVEDDALRSGGGFVLVVDDDPDVGEHIARAVCAAGCRAVAADDYERAWEIVLGARPSVLVLDQIVESPESDAFLQRLEALEEDAPFVVLLRYRNGPVGPFRNLQVTVVGGEDWFERLPSVVAARVYAYAY